MIERYCIINSTNVIYPKIVGVGCKWKKIVAFFLFGIKNESWNFYIKRDIFILHGSP